MQNDAKKKIQSAVETGAGVEGIKRVLKCMKVKSNFEYAKQNPRTNKTFRQQPG